jgi:hypothetical protein
MPTLGNEQFAGWSRNCVPTYRISLFNADGAAGSLLIAPSDEALSGYLELSSRAPSSIHIGTLTANISTPDGQSKRVKLEQRFLTDEQPTDLLKVQTFLFSGAIQKSAERVSIQLPEMAVNGATQPPVEIEFSLRRKPMLVGACQ